MKQVKRNAYRLKINKTTKVLEIWSTWLKLNRPTPIEALAKSRPIQTNIWKQVYAKASPHLELWGWVTALSFWASCGEYSQLNFNRFSKRKTKKATRNKKLKLIKADSSHPYHKQPKPQESSWNHEYRNPNPADRWKGPGQEHAAAYCLQSNWRNRS